MLYFLITYLALIHNYGLAITLFVILNGFNSLGSIIEHGKKDELNPGCLIIIVGLLFAATTYIGVNYISWLNGLLA